MKILSDKEYRKRLHDVREQMLKEHELRHTLRRMEDRMYMLEDEIQSVKGRLTYMADRVFPPTIERGKDGLNKQTGCD